MTAYDPGTSDKAMPAGVIVPFAGEENRIPTGWALCDGRKVSKDDPSFSRLFEAIGTVWGGSGTPFFYLPDLRGLFLRGVAGESTRDPDKDNRASPRMHDLPTNPGNGGNAVGSIQSDMFASHTHPVGPLNIGWSNLGNGDRHRLTSDDGPSWSGTDWPQTANASGGAETRPRNAYVHFIIKL